MALSTIAGVAGYSLPDDLLSGTGLRFVDGLIRSIPLIGTWAEFFIFNGEFPGDLVIPRLYMVHILLVPALLLGLIAVMPMLGHASWHAYRDLVDASSLPLRDAAVATGQRSGVSS